MDHSRWIVPLAAGPIDVIGDVHGEHDALRSLLGHLGYDGEGRHPRGRTLAFVGDLTDRGPDSIGVVRLVRALVDAGRAVCVLGNHEINVLRKDLKHGNAWALQAPRDAHKGNFPHSADGEEAASFFARLPLAAAHTELRIVHAAWSGDAFRSLDSLAPDLDVLAAFERFESITARELVEKGLLNAQRRAEKELGGSLHDVTAEMSMQPAIGGADEYRQMNNPVRVLTSGPERVGITPFFNSGNWRFADRERWWDTYTGTADVICGHYWRWPVPVDRAAIGKGDPDLFQGVPATGWLGPARRVFCVDYGVGRRAAERAAGAGPADRNNKLAALRWNGIGNAAEVVFDDGVAREASR